MGSATTTNLDVLESHVGPQREPAPDKPTRFGKICLNALGNSASNKSTQLRVVFKQATRFFCRLVLKRFVLRETANEINIFCRNAFEWHKGTFANYLLNLSYCLIKVMCFSRLHLWKKKCCKPWERQPTNPFRFGAILVRFQNHIRSARLKLLTLSSFNHTAGRRFLPFGITAISKWFGDYLSLTTQGELICDMQHLQLQF